MFDKKALKNFSFTLFLCFPQPKAPTALKYKTRKKQISPITSYYEIKPTSEKGSVIDGFEIHCIYNADCRGWTLLQSGFDISCVFGGKGLIFAMNRTES